MLLQHPVPVSQVFDLSKDKPDQVLKRLWANFDAADKAGDKSARRYQRRLRIVVAGGDGTIAWWVGLSEQQAQGAKVLLRKLEAPAARVASGAVC